MEQKAGELRFQEYDHRSALMLFEKWGIDLKEEGIEIN